MKIYINGTFYEKDQAVISVFDHGLLYGDGVFEGIRIYNGIVFKLEEHLTRLFESAAAIRLSIPLGFTDLKNAVLESVKINNKKDGYIRLVITRGTGPLGLSPDLCPQATTIIIVSDIQLYPEEFYQKGIRIITASTRKIAPDSMDSRIKSLNYLSNILAKIEAQNSKALEAVMLNRNGYVAECTGDNIFIVKNNILLTPPATQGALDGITRKVVLELALNLNITAKETDLTQFDLYTADECFLTGSGAEMIPVIDVDGRTIGNGIPGNMTRQLIDQFKKLTSAQ